jgi:glucosamine-phosphate N-acetyltransferase
MHVEDVAVREDFQGTGIGTLMMNYLEGEAKKANCYKIILDCSEKNVNFYEKCGYVRQEVQMRKNL